MKAPPFVRVEFRSASAFPFGPRVRTNAAGRWLHATTEQIPVVAVLWDGRELLLGTIPAGFLTDAISSPWWARPFGFKPWGKGWEEAVWHDWMLELMALGVVGKPKMTVDLLMALVGIARGRSFLRALLMFFAVRTRRRRRSA